MHLPEQPGTFEKHLTVSLLTQGKKQFFSFEKQFFFPLSMAALRDKESGYSVSASSSSSRALALSLSLFLTHTHNTQHKRTLSLPPPHTGPIYGKNEAPSPYLLSPFPWPSSRITRTHDARWCVCNSCDNHVKKEWGSCPNCGTHVPSPAPAKLSPWCITALPETARPGQELSSRQREASRGAAKTSLRPTSPPRPIRYT